MAEDTAIPEWFEILASSYSIQILEACGKPRSAGELSTQLDAPIATVYRRLDVLVDSGSLELDGKRLSDDGRREKCYRRTMDGFSVEFQVDSVTVTTKDHSEARSALAETWSSLQPSESD